LPVFEKASRKSEVSL